ncbi:MAG TPA: SMP-30/gluconolactonase/LRE family protein [Roseiarcus sp.]|nr:SMP-30/gluconolactonase/LRE family protein [Roseiarcus sp.]
MRKLTTLIDGLSFPEGPRWHDGKLFFSDMHAHKVIAADMTGRTETICEVPAWPSGLGWLPDGRMLVVSMTDRRLLRLDRDGLKVAADLSKLASFHCNDMVVDAKGRAYVGNFGFDLHAQATPKFGELVMVEPNGAARVVAGEMKFPNGTVITPDGKTLIVGESTGACLTAFDIGADGSLSNRRLWAEIAPAIPDGITLDAEGAVWVASPLTDEVIRVHQGGEVTERIKTANHAYACMLGGPDRRTLFVLTAADSDPDKCRAKPTGRIETTPVEIASAGFP